MSLSLNVINNPRPTPCSTPEALQAVPIEQVPEIRQGYVIYRGPSMLDGKPIVVIATGFKGHKSKNAKTGSMTQVWVLADGVDPVHAVWKGRDASVCGTCKHRPNSRHNPFGWTTCYVNIAQAPLAVYRTYKAGKYKKMTPADWYHLRGRHVRLGAYGDPAAIPFDLLERIVNTCERHTGYTHQWAYCDQRLRKYVMASCDTPEETARAQAKGWRTFRVRLDDEPVQPGERICPASEEAGKVATCNTCMACHGTKSNGPNTRANITIIVHGSQWKPARFRKVRMLQRAHRKWTDIVKVRPQSIKQREIDKKGVFKSRHRKKVITR